MSRKKLFQSDNTSREQDTRVTIRHNMIPDTLISQCGSTHNCPGRSVSEETLSCCWDVKQSSNNKPRGRYHGGRRPSSDDSFHSPTVIPPSALDKPSIMKCYHRRRACSHTSPRRSPTMVTFHDTRFVECRWWNDGWIVKDCRHLTVVGLHDTGPRPPQLTVIRCAGFCAVRGWLRAVCQYLSSVTPPPPPPPPPPVFLLCAL